MVDVCTQITQSREVGGAFLFSDVLLGNAEALAFVLPQSRQTPGDHDCIPWECRLWGSTYTVGHTK
jgi:hypothetical protein